MNFCKVNSDYEEFFLLYEFLFRFNFTKFISVKISGIIVSVR